MRKDGDKYYWRDLDSSRKEVLAMDFSLKVGDVHSWDWVDSHMAGRRWLVLESKDTLFAGENFKRKYIHLNRMYDSADILMPYHVDTWVEGLGSLSFGMGDPQFPWYGRVRWPFLLCCTNASDSFKWDVSLEYESLSIYFPNGILLRNMKIESDQSQILVDKLPKGVYLYIIRASDNSQTSGKFSVM